MFSQCVTYLNKLSPSISNVSHQHSALTVLEENERIFTELLLSIERKHNEVKEMIRSHEKTTVTRAEILLNRLEEEITLLRKRHTDLEKLSHTDDHIHFLQVSLICTEDPHQDLVWCKKEKTVVLCNVWAMY